MSFGYPSPIRSSQPPASGEATWSFFAEIGSIAQVELAQKTVPKISARGHLVNSADQLLSLLQLFTHEKPKWTVDEASKEIGVSVSTAYRYFRSLCSAGLLDRFGNGDYILGPAIIEFDRRIRTIDPLIKVARPAMQRLVARSENIGVALLCRIYHNRVMCVHQECKGIPAESLGYERGRPMPMFLGATSKIIFANLPSRLVRWFFTRSHDEIAQAGLGDDWDEVKVNLRSIRKAGISVTHGEIVSGHVGIAAPVFGLDGSVIGSITLVVFEKEATPEIVANSTALVQAAGREIDAALRLHAPYGADEEQTRTERAGSVDSLQPQVQTKFKGADPKGRRTRNRIGARGKAHGTALHA